MPSVKSMFPSKYLSYGDLEKNKMYRGTIRAVTPQAMKAGFGGAATEVSWLLHFHEWNKPMVLKKNKAEKIAMIIGHDDTDKWIGQQIGFYRGVWTNGGESGEGLMIDDRPVPVTPTAAPALSGGAVAASDQRKMPRPAVDRFQATIAEKGQNWDGFLRWLKTKDPAVFGLVWGEDFDRIPGAAIHYMKLFLDDLHGNSAAAQHEVIDRSTGEIVSGLEAARAAAPATGARPTVPASLSPAPASSSAQSPTGYPFMNQGGLAPAMPDEIDADDIPF